MSIMSIHERIIGQFNNNCPFKGRLIASYFLAASIFPTNKVEGGVSVEGTIHETTNSEDGFLRQYAGSSYYFPSQSNLAPYRDDDVDVRLLLVIDASKSMSDSEFKTQIDVTASALESEEVRKAWFGYGGVESIAIAVVEFGEGAAIRIPWVDFRKDDPALEDRLREYADLVTKLGGYRDRGKENATQIGVMLDYAKTVFENAPWDGLQRSVIDVFSDGKNAGPSMEKPRRELAEMGIMINALAIVNEEADLDDYYSEKLTTQWDDIPDGSYLIPGRVWAVARKMDDSVSKKEMLTSFQREVEFAFHHKIVWESVMLDIVIPDMNYTNNADGLRLTQ